MNIGKVFSHSVIYGLSNILSKSIAFVLIPIYTRFLSTSEFGILSIATVISTLLMNIYQFGQAGALQKFFYDFKKEDTKKLIGTILIFELIVVIILAVVFSIFGPILFGLFLPGINFHPIILIVVWSAAFSTFAFFPQVLLRVEKKPISYSVLLISRFLLTNILIIFLVVFLKKGVIGALLGILISAAVFFVIYIYHALKRSILRIDVSKLKLTLLFGLPLIPHAMSGWILTFIDRFMIERISGLSQVGIYSLGYNLGLAMSIIVTSINLAWVPFFFETAKKRGEKAPKIFSKIIIYYTLVIITIALILSVFSKEIVVIFSTPAYYSASVVMPIIVVTYAVQGFYFIAVNALFLKSKTTFIAITTTVIAVTNILLNLYLIPKFGILGAAWATLLSFLFFYLVIYKLAQKYYYIHYFWDRMLKIIFVAIFVYIISTFIHTENIMMSGLYKAVILLIFPLTLYLTGFFAKKEIQFLLNFIRDYKYRNAKK